MEDLREKIIQDAENGLSYAKIMKKYNLKSNYLIKKALGKRTGGYNYYGKAGKDFVVITKKELENLNEYQLTCLCNGLNGAVNEYSIKRPKKLNKLYNVAFNILIKKMKEKEKNN